MSVDEQKDHSRSRPRLRIGLFFGLLFLLSWAITRVELVPLWGEHPIPFISRFGWRILTPAAISGDEPHYLVVVNSLLFDHSFEVRHQYSLVTAGGYEAGAPFRLVPSLSDHHTILVNQRTGDHQLVQGSYYDPEFLPSPDVYEVSAHPVAFPALLALIIAPFHPSLVDVEREVGLVLAVISWLGAMGTYFLARSDGKNRGTAVVVVLVLVLASPWLAYTRAYYPEATVGGVLVLAMWASISERPVLAALGTAAAAIFKPAFGVVGLGLIFDMLRERRGREALQMISVLGACGATLFGFNYWLTRTPVPGMVLGFGSVLKLALAAVIAGLTLYLIQRRERREAVVVFALLGLCWMALSAFNYLARIPSSPGPAEGLESTFLWQLGATFFAKNYGLLVFVPWTIFAFIGIGAAFVSDAADSKLLRRMAFPLILYAVLLALQGSTPGYSYGPRYWVAFLPWLSVAAVQQIASAGRLQKGAFTVLTLIGVAIAIPGALRYPQLFAQPPSAAWRGPTVDRYRRIE